MIVYNYLEFEGYSDIVYEPKGNIPPDFLLNGQIAIEARRLNQHLTKNDKVEPLERLEYKLIPMLKVLLDEFSEGTHENTSFVCIRYSRPIGKVKECIKDIRNALVSHLPLLKERGVYKISDTVEVELLPASTQHTSAYVLGSIMDADAGGWIVSEVYKNIKIVLEEKSYKVSKYKDNYKEWWLILVDHIGYGLDQIDIKQLQELSILTNGWNKVILVSPINYEHGIEIFSDV